MRLLGVVQNELRSEAWLMVDAIEFQPVHPFPARMAPSIALEELPKAGKRPLKVLDPMVGSGTTLLAARSRGHEAVGFDTDPLALLITKVSCTDIRTSAVRSAAEATLDRARILCQQLLLAEAYPEEADTETKAFVRFWFDSVNRKQLRALAEAISEVKRATTRNVLWCAFSRLIIAKARGASLAMDLSHSRPHKVLEKTPFRPLPAFLGAVQTVLDRAQFAEGTLQPNALVRAGDARSLPLQDESIDVVITSPPYLNAIDYLRCSKFSLVWMGYSIGELREVRRKNVGTEASNGADPASSTISEALKAAGGVRHLPSREQGMLARYALDMSEVVSEISRVLVPCGRSVFVIGDCTMRGVFIRNSKIIEVLAEHHGLSVANKKSRALPANRRYLPPPSSRDSGEQLDSRLRREIVLTMTKGKAA